MFNQIDWANGPVTLQNARVPVAMLSVPLPIVHDGLAAVDLTIAGGGLLRLTPAGAAAPLGQAVDLAQRMVWALPVDCHTHIDKAQILPRCPGADGHFAGALQAAAADKPHFTVDDIAARASFAIDCAAAHGTGALRSHVDADPSYFDAAFERLCDLADGAEMRIELAPFTGIGADPAFLDHLAQRAQHRCSGVLSAFLFSDPNLDDFLDQLFRLALRYDLALDFHADENLDPNSHCARKVAQAALRHRFTGPLMIGHLCALGVQSPSDQAITMDLLAQAGATVVALPLCNLHLQDRPAGQIRGAAPIKALRAAGVPVAIASDNTRDPFFAYGDLNMAELFRFAMIALQLDYPVGDWPAAIGQTAALAIGDKDAGNLSEGGPADFMVFAARNWSEFGARPAAAQLLLRGGQAQSTQPPDFARLDDLVGLGF